MFLHAHDFFASSKSNTLGVLLEEKQTLGCKLPTQKFSILGEAPRHAVGSFRRIILIQPGNGRESLVVSQGGSFLTMAGTSKDFAWASKAIYLLGPVSARAGVG